MRTASVLTLLTLIVAPAAVAQIEVDAAGNARFGANVQIDGVITGRLGIAAAARPNASLFIAYPGDADFTYGLLVEATEPAMPLTMGMRTVVLTYPGRGYGSFAYGGFVGAFGGAQGAPGVTPYVIGLNGVAWGALANYGLSAVAHPNGTGPNADNFGVVGHAFGGTGLNVGVYGVAGSSAPGGDAGARYAGYFAGDLVYTGTMVGGSDERFKQDVQPLAKGTAMSGLGRLTARRYRYRQEVEGRPLGSDEREHYGFVAQEVEAVFPELVHDVPLVMPPAVDAQGRPAERKATAAVVYKGVAYAEMIPLLVQALQEQQAEIAALREALRRAGIAVPATGN